MYKIINGTPGTNNCYFISKEKAKEVCQEIKKLSQAFKDAKVIKATYKEAGL